MNDYETILIIGFIAFYLLAFGLYHLMIFRVNRHLPPDLRIPHFLYKGEWNRLGREYKGFYPRSFLYEFTLSCAVGGLIIAISLAGFSFWEYATGR